MDKIQPSGINTTPLKPKENAVPIDEAVSNEAAQNEDTQATEQEEYRLHSTVDPSVNPALFHIARRAVLHTEIVSDFIKEHAEKIGDPTIDRTSEEFQNAVAHYLSNILKPDRDFEDEINKKLSGIPFDLVEDLKKRITANEYLNQSAVILKMLFSIGDKDDILHELMIPFIEERSELGSHKIVEDNKDVYLRFLRSLSDEELKETLLSIRYKEIIRADNFGLALLKVREPKFILDILEECETNAASIDNYQFNTTLLEQQPGEPFSQENERQIALQKIQLMQLAILQNSEARNKLQDEAVKYLERLYSSALNKRISDDIANLLSDYYPKFSKSVFIRELENTRDDEGEINRRRRYSTVKYLVNFIGYDSKSVDYLKKFILKEKDPFVLSPAVYLLAGYLGDPGEEALTDVIINQIKNEVTPLPLAVLSLLYISNGNNSYLNLIKDIFSFDYNDKDKKLIKTAFENLSRNYLCPVLKKEKDDFLFDPVDIENTELVIDLIERIGPNTFFQWALGNSKDDRALRTNSQEVLDYACTINPGRVYSLLVKILANEPTSENAKLTKKLAGVSQTGNSDLEFQD